MTKETAETIKMMIEKECQRESLTELCENHGVSVDDFDEFLDNAVKHCIEIEGK